MLRRLLIAIALFLTATLAAQGTVAQTGKISVIRDSEIEHTLRGLTEPVFRMAGLVPDSVHLVIVNDRDLNAFASSGNRMFIHTGLIMQSKPPVHSHLIRAKAGQSTELGRVIYANSITLTPGTITLDLRGEDLLVHALTKATAEGVPRSAPGF